MTRLGSLVVFAALAAATPSLAQDTPPPPAPQPGGEQQPGGDQQPGERERREERRRNRGGGGMGLPVEQLTEELGLTPEQVQQVEELNREMREKGRTLMREAFQSGDPQAAREKIRGMFEETFTKLDGMLTPEQKEKAKGLRERLQERMRGRFERGQQGRGGRGGFGRENSRARLKDQALEALALTEEEKAVVTPLLDTCLETRELLVQEGERRRQEFLQKARETSEPEALGKLLEEFRASREADKATARQTMDQLREVLTVEQEAKLVGLGVLD